MIQIPLNITLLYKKTLSNGVQSDAGEQKYNFYMQLHQPVKISIKGEKKIGYVICFAIVNPKRASHLII